MGDTAVVHGGRPWASNPHRLPWASLDMECIGLMAVGGFPGTCHSRSRHRPSIHGCPPCVRIPRCAGFTLRRSKSLQGKPERQERSLVTPAAHAQKKPTVRSQSAVRRVCRGPDYISHKSSRPFFEGSLTAFLLFARLGNDIIKGFVFAKCKVWF